MRKFLIQRSLPCTHASIAHMIQSHMIWFQVRTAIASYCKEHGPLATSLKYPSFSSVFGPNTCFLARFGLKNESSARSIMASVGMSISGISNAANPVGRPTLLTDHEEQRLVGHVRALRSQGVAVSSHMVAAMAMEIFKQERPMLVQRDFSSRWARLFVERHGFRYRLHSFLS